jgi:hypothetical protein
MQSFVTAAARSTIASGHVMREPETHEISEERYREWQAARDAHETQRERVAQSLGADPRAGREVYPARESRES